MNYDLLKEAEAKFLERYPGGFDHPDLMAIGKKHMMENRIEQSHQMFSLDQFIETDDVVDSMIKMVSRSSLVSVFEKPKFKEVVQSFGATEKQQLAAGLQAWLYGDAQEGFVEMVSVLQKWKIAKWPILTVIPTYFRPSDEVFVKPTTAKGIISYFQVENLKYSPKPSWDFYSSYRELIKEMKASVDSSLTKYNAAFCGFLMMSIEA